MRTVNLGEPSVGAAEMEAVGAVIASGWLSGAGPMCRALEDELAVIVGAGSTLATANCGSALHLALLTLGVRPGDEVIVADYTFPATGHAVRWVGATPVFADVRPDTWCIDTGSVAALVTPRTVGIVAVDVFGQPADYDELRALARTSSLWLVEDAACALGATYRGRPAGSLADLAAFSFHGRKGATAGEGGALVAPTSDGLDRARALHTYGTEPAYGRASSAASVTTFSEIGYNYRLSEIQAAILRVQLQRLPELLAARSAAATGYAELLSGFAQVELPTVLPDRTHPWQSFVLTLDPSLDRDAVALGLRERGVGCTFGTFASHLQHVYGSAQMCPVSADVAARHLAIPMHANLVEDDIAYVADALRSVLGLGAVRAERR
jgi:dTDP-4-amino-4,6-dideoxygalactose transaminase